MHNANLTLRTKIYAGLGLVLAILLVFFMVRNAALKPLSGRFFSAPQNNPSDASLAAPSSPVSEFISPLDNALARIAKKPFGIHITPQTSPVQPEKFQGFHTGTDFEIFPEEQDEDVAVRAACSGQLLLKKYAGGYGGVAVQSCALDGQPVTVVYGHLRLSGIKVSVGQDLKAGDELAVLGKGYSPETDYERKHLHLGIHRGAEINLRGYVADKTLLGEWIDAQTLLK